jgi:hypothetical protein
VTLTYILPFHDVDATAGGVLYGYLIGDEDSMDVTVDVPPLSG